MMEIRPAGFDDVQAISSLARQTYADAFGHSMSPTDLAAHFYNHLTPEHFAGMLREDMVLVACVGPDIIGFVQFGNVAIELGELLPSSDLQFMPGDMELRRLYVLAAYQNRGVGSQLMEVALGHPLLRAGANIFLDVWQENEGAQRFYQRYGFVRVGEKRFEVEAGQAAGVDYIMRRDSRHNLES